jgi:hypothetical protein
VGKATRKNFEEKYQWHLSGKMWEDCFDSFDIPPMEETWAAPPRIRQPQPKPQELPPNVSHGDLARWLITDVLCEPERLNTFFEARLCRDLAYQSSTSTTGGMYFNESSAAFDGNAVRNPFNFDMAYEHMAALCARRNEWESARMQMLNSKK